MNNNKDFIKFIPCLYASFVIGLVALEIGVLLPYLMEELQLNYTLMGGLLSMFAVGNLFASPINSYMIPKIGKKAAILLFSSMIPIAFLLLTFLLSRYWLYVIVAMLGLGRGSISIYIYSTANDETEGKPIHVHWLSIIFAVGALMAPLLTNTFLHFGMQWRQIIFIFFGMTLLVPILFLISKCGEYSTSGYSSNTSLKRSNGSNRYNSSNSSNSSDSSDSSNSSDSSHSSDSSDCSDSSNSSGSGDYSSTAYTEINLGNIEHADKIYFKSTGFYVLGLILFFYIGIENCVNGWFVSYFKEMKIMTNAYANTLVSITWMFVIIGRFTSAFLSSKLQRRQIILANCIGAAVCFLLLIATRQLGIITVSIVGIGFFCAGIYPTTITSSKTVLKGSISGMSMLLAIAALGGIITPQLVGIIADSLGLVTAIIYLLIIMICMLIFALVNFNKKYSEDIK